MNPRIEQLIKQATMIEDHYPEGCNGYPVPRVWFDKVKFAELIVRECADLFDKDEIELTLTERTIHNTIKEHFGVE